MMEVKIRQAKNNEEDSAIYGELYRNNCLEKNKAIYGKEFKDIGSEPGKADFGVGLRSGEIVLFAEIEDEVVGYLHGKVLNNYEREESEGSIYDIFVLENYRKKGIGTGLVNHFREMLEEKGSDKNKNIIYTPPLELELDKAIKFFESLGFEVKARVYGKEVK
ncbi:MAG: N-acetyltransferase family protein [Candidatus Pacearchaeota archaeon]